MKKAIVLVGLILIGFAIFARQLGIDNDSGWGTGRILILAAGLSIVAIGLIAFRFPEHFSRLTYFVLDKKYLILAAMLVAVIYAWVSQVNIKFLRTDIHYYGELAQSFKSGQLHLAEEPSAALLALADPYDYDLRTESKVEDFPWDASLYNGKFYLYYGPVPAVFLSVLSKGLIAQVADRHLVIVFAFGLFLYGLLIVHDFFARTIPNAPDWLVALCALTFGLTAPSAIMVQESRLYQVAVFGAQFFFIGGCYWAYAAMTKDRLFIWKLVLAGIHWALVLGTRVSIAPVVLFAVTSTIISIWLLYKPSLREITIPALAIGIPMLAAAVSLAWYNWARFGSISEFGLTYTLTNIDYTKAQDLFALDRIAPNFYNYFLHPLQVSRHFPYLTRIEYVTSNERLGGLLYIAPYILFALLPVILGIRMLTMQKKVSLPSLSDIRPESWLLVTSAGAAIIGSVTILSFLTVELRYIEDFMPSLLLFTNAHIGLEYSRLENRAGWQKLFIFLVVVLALLTMVASTLVALKSTSLGIAVDLIDSILRILNVK